LNLINGELSEQLVSQLYLSS